MSEITDEQKLEIKNFIDNLTAQYTDTISVIYGALGLSEPSVASEPIHDNHKPVYRGANRLSKGETRC